MIKYLFFSEYFLTAFNGVRFFCIVFFKWVKLLPFKSKQITPVTFNSNTKSLFNGQIIELSWNIENALWYELKFKNERKFYTPKFSGIDYKISFGSDEDLKAEDMDRWRYSGTTIKTIDNSIKLFNKFNLNDEIELTIVGRNFKKKFVKFEVSSELVLISEPKALIAKKINLAFNSILTSKNKSRCLNFSERKIELTQIEKYDTQINQILKNRNKLSFAINPFIKQNYL
jgi:hypothetical protein